MTENPTGTQPVLRLTIDLPGVYTADLDDLMEIAAEDLPESATDSDLLLECLSIATQVGVRMMWLGEKDADMVQLRGEIVAAALSDGGMGDE